MPSIYDGKTPDQIAAILYGKGLTQEGVNALYAARGLPNPPTIPDSVTGIRRGTGRDMLLYDVATGKKIRGGHKDVYQLYSQVVGEAMDPWRKRSGISNLAGGILNFGMNYLGGPVGQAFTAIADYGNKALGNDDGTSYTDGKRSNADRIGALAGSIGSSMEGPGSYGASQGAGNGLVENTGSGTRGIDYPNSGAGTIGTIANYVNKGAKLAGIIKSLSDRRGSSSPKTPPNGGATNGTDTLPVTPYNRVQTPFTGDYMKYGMGPEHRFFTTPPPAAQLPVSGHAHGGTIERYVSGGTGAGGREDNIDAKLSENEYVIDAETVALLGDGNPEAGARKLDTMRKNIRSHKGKALASGSISPDAHESPLQYLASGGKVSGAAGVIGALKRQMVKTRMKQMDRRGTKVTQLVERDRQQSARDKRDHGMGEYRMVDEVSNRINMLHDYKAEGHKNAIYAEGGRVGALRRLLKRTPKPDPNAKLREILANTEQALKYRPPRTPPKDVPLEDFANDILKGGGKYATGGKVNSIVKAVRSKRQIYDSAVRAVKGNKPFTRENARELCRLQGWPDHMIDRVMAEHAAFVKEVQ